MKILMVSRWFPWPADTGSRIRILGVLEGLARIGEVDLFVLAPGARSPTVPKNSPAARVEVGSRVGSSYRGLGRVSWAIGGRLPLEIAGCDYSELLDLFTAWKHPNYDAIWCNRAVSYVALKAGLHGPTIVDLDDLEDQKLLRAHGIEGDRDDAPLTHRWNAFRDRKNARLWGSLQRDIAASVDAVAVASEVDRTRLGVSNAVVIPNGFTAPERAIGKRRTGVPPTILFQGLLTYAPNVDAADFLVREILPRLRARLGQVRVRLVGQVDQRVSRLHEDPEVTVTGPVAGMSDELAKADLVLVPIRFGSGTRVKILEAFANRVPVVSTSLGAEGLRVESGRHLLVADTADGLADACAALLSDPPLRERLVDEAETLFEQRYRWDRIHELIASLVELVRAPSPTVGDAHRRGTGIEGRGSPA